MHHAIVSILTTASLLSSPLLAIFCLGMHLVPARQARCT